MTDKVRVRFAPSPTGPLHIGGVRTALFNYLYAKKYNGTFVLRIEDTDQNRYVEGAEEYITNALEWCGIPYDEGPKKDGGYGPYRQSERKQLYKDFANELLDKGHAYYAFDSADSLEQHRKSYEAEGKTFIYNWHNRMQLDNSLVLEDEIVKSRIEKGDSYVIRFKSPKNETLTLSDEIRGNIKIDSNTLDDKVLFKSDGMPTYHLANIVDDHLMEISHVIRGEEWLPSLALHYLLYRAFNWTPPKFAHLPLILKPTGKGKLSKRDGDKGGFPVFPLEWKTEDNVTRGFREDGYLPEAVVNFLAFLGWNPGTEQEIFSLEELALAFDLNRVNKAGAKFDPEKAKWFNQNYFVRQSNAKITSDFKTKFQSELPEEIDDTVLESAIGLVKERASNIDDIWGLTHYFFISPNSYNPKALKKAYKEDTEIILNKIIELVQSVETFDAESLQSKIKTWITEEGIGFGKVMQPLRLSLVGDLKGPDVFDIMVVIGKQETIKRIEAIKKATCR